MKHKRRVYLVETTCRRCGKPLLTASRSIMGADRAKVAYGSICSECMGEDERRDMTMAIGTEAIGKVHNGGLK